MRVNGRKVTMTFLAVSAATLLLASLSLGAAQSTNWTLTVTAASGSYTSTCTFGVNSSASSVSSGFDQTYDQVVPPPPPTGVYSYLYYPNNSASPVDLQDLSTSLIAPTDSWTWTYCLENIGATGTVVVSWTSGNIVTTSMTLQPTGAASVNMLTTSQYSFTATQGQTYTFSLTQPWTARIALFLVFAFIQLCNIKNYHSRRCSSRCNRGNRFAHEKKV